MARGPALRLTVAAALAAALCASTTARTARAEGPRPYVTWEDDGALKTDFTKTKESPTTIAKKVLAKYDEAGEPRPEVLSVWTTFPMTGNDVATYIMPLVNDVKGIGFDAEYGGDGTFDRKVSGVRAVLLHNNVTVLDKRAKQSGAPSADGFAEYLFLLELSHLWGPAARLPTKDPAVPADAMIGFTYHWSFFVDAGGSPAGGNKWKDNGDGTFTTLPQKPGEVAYSMLDLYLMGLATKAEVGSFAVLASPVVQGTPKDPFTRGDVTATTFPWFSDPPVTVKATRVVYGVDDVVQAKGPRVPDAAAAPKKLTFGMALVTEPGAAPEKVAEYKKTMDQVAGALPAAFARATRGRGTLEVVTHEVTAGPADAGADGAATAPPPAAAAPAADDGGCAAAPRGGAAALAPILAVVAAAGAALRRRQRRP